MLLRPFILDASVARNESTSLMGLKAQAVPVISLQ